MVLSRLGAVAADRGVRVHVVGGFVRDMLLGRPNLDIDVVVEGDGVAFGEAAADALEARVTTHRRFGTAVLVMPDGLHIDVASSRSEYYTRPGALPTVERSTLRQDLFRRDFTLNAMAACIEPGCFGSIADPFGGLRDLEHGLVRVLHALSFVEDPTRLLRAARFEVRYGFALDAQTEQLARQAAEMEVLGEVSGARIREELYDIFDEEDPVAVLARLDELGALGPLLPPGAVPRVVLERCADALSSLTRLARDADALDARSLFVALLATAGKPESVERWLRHLRIGRDRATAAQAIVAARAAERSLADRRGMRDSRLARMLDALPLEALVVLWARGGELARERIEHYATGLAGVGPAVSGRDLIALGATPGERFSAILAKARDDRLDGRAVGRDAELANLRRLARNAGLIPSGKDSA
jgi:tRNA nucleotidyltransferase (CCA-adding enzyme)